MRKCLHIAILVFVIMTAAMVLWLSSPDSAQAQSTRYVTPAGFEFATTTSVLKYYYPLKGAKANTYKGTWIAEVAEGVRRDYIIDAAEVKPGSGAVVSFSLNKSESEWPAGLYRLEIRADGRLVHTERFVIG